ncbi:DUF3168 domain-containing protein [Gymnodinialimonas ceratoperidinii]|uniref:DUF3168 domain-containing protein n=1 Tax=Gymnodinialimonas ceratoperidinii TaxID=2856823 RepID=A0A8F6YC62_9RHOB|nr:DUF3168 domain-containing protein [Gymnodinialimonas ceratoperidinii]QXT38887.1 DUF3168 domain-containing protein [Gymnodinialimonas ceratoperidinii]
MSYAATAALQEAVYAALTMDASVASLTQGAIYDALPPGPVPPIYVSLGPERARDASDATGFGAVHDFPVTVVSDAAGFHTAKTIAAAVSDALSDADLTLARGNLIGLRFLRARARRVGDGREIEIWFRAMIDASGA